MAAKKYLSLEEAAAFLGVSTKELISLRERQEVRGYADRGTWKFKSEDVEEYKRRQQTDSNPDLPMLGDDDLMGEEPTVIRRSALEDDDDDIPRGTSDSDVRLIVDPELSAIVTGTAKPKNLADSDSDVRLLDSSAARRRKGSDSEVKLVGSLADSDSDVRLADKSPPAAKGSDSDVLLVSGKGKGKSPAESDSDVKLLPNKKKGVYDTEADMGVLALPPGLGSDSVFGDDDLVLDDESGLTLKGASGISLEKLIDSGISLESGDSGIALMGNTDSDKLGGSGILLSGDSGIALANDPPKSGGPKSGGPKSEVRGTKAMTRPGASSKPAPVPQKPAESDSRSTRAMTRGGVPPVVPSADSSLTLADDSGLALEGTDDGIVLDMDDESGIGLVSAGDSGIALERPADSGISLESDDDLNRTMPMLGLSDDLDGTNVEVPLMSDDDASNYELKMPGADSGDDVADTSVIMFDDDEAESEGATRLRHNVDDDEEVESFDLQDAGDDGEEGSSDLDVSDDIIGEDDELDEMDVFDAADEDFDESFVTGESHAEFVAPTRAAASFEAPPAEWGGGTFAGLAVSTGLLALCGMVMFDLVRSMWSWNEPTGVTKALLEQLKTLFG